MPTSLFHEKEQNQSSRTRVHATSLKSTFREFVAHTPFDRRACVRLSFFGMFTRCSIADRLRKVDEREKNEVFSLFTSTNSKFSLTHKFPILLTLKRNNSKLHQLIGLQTLNLTNPPILKLIENSQQNRDVRNELKNL